MIKRNKRYVAYYDGTLDDKALDPELATSERDGLMSKEDKEQFDKLLKGEGLRITADNVICDPNNRFVTDVQITKINNAITKCDSNAFTYNDDGSLNIRGFNDAPSGAQLLKGADGQVVWSQPTTDTTLEDAINKLKSEVVDLTSIVNDKANTVDVYTKSEVDHLIATANHLKRKKVSSVDEIDTTAENFIYMITKTDGAGNDHFDEYMVIEGEVEKIGSTAVDLTGYVKTPEMETALSTKVDKVEGKGLSTHDLTDELLAKINSVSNTLTTVRINGVALPMIDREVNIPIASSTNLGVVKSSTGENKVSINVEGEMEINNINVNTLRQTEGEYFVVSSGDSGDYFD